MAGQRKRGLQRKLRRSTLKDRKKKQEVASEITKADRIFLNKGRDQVE